MPFQTSSSVFRVHAKEVRRMLVRTVAQERQIAAMWDLATKKCYAILPILTIFGPFARNGDGFRCDWQSISTSWSYHPRDNMHHVRHF